MFVSAIIAAGGRGHRLGGATSQAAAVGRRPADSRAKRGGVSRTIRRSTKSLSPCRPISPPIRPTICDEPASRCGWSPAASGGRIRSRARSSQVAAQCGHRGRPRRGASVRQRRADRPHHRGGGGVGRGARGDAGARHGEAARRREPSGCAGPSANRSSKTLASRADFPGADAAGVSPRRSCATRSRLNEDGDRRGGAGRTRRTCRCGWSRARRRTSRSRRRTILRLPRRSRQASAAARARAPAASRCGSAPATICIGWSRARPLVLGGVDDPVRSGALGHSDADVVCHAVTDAVLGAAGLGDIGRHFPDTDPRWKDASSLDLLRACRGNRRASAVSRSRNVDVVVDRSSGRSSRRMSRRCAQPSPAALGIDVDAREHQGQDQRGRRRRRPRRGDRRARGRAADRRPIGSECA